MAEGKTPQGAFPRLSDIDSMIKLRANWGAISHRTNPRINLLAMVRISTARWISPSPMRHKCEARYDIVKTMRASICVLGPLLAKQAARSFRSPADAPLATVVDLHVRGLQKLGAEIRTENGNIVGEVRGRLKAAECTLLALKGPTGAWHHQCDVRRRRWTEGDTVIVVAAWGGRA